MSYTTSDYFKSSIDLDMMMHLNIWNLVSAGAECPQHQGSSAELDGAHRVFWEWTQNMNAKLFAEKLMSKWMNACGQHSSVRHPSPILHQNWQITVLRLCSSTPICLPSLIKLLWAETLSCCMFTECLTQIRLLDTNIIKIHYSKNLN